MATGTYYNRQGRGAPPNYNTTSGWATALTTLNDLVAGDTTTGPTFAISDNLNNNFCQVFHQAFMAYPTAGAMLDSLRFVYGLSDVLQNPTFSVDRIFATNTAGTTVAGTLSATSAVTSAFTLYTYNFPTGIYVSAGIGVSSLEPGCGGGGGAYHFTAWLTDLRFYLGGQEVTGTICVTPGTAVNLSASLICCGTQAGIAWTAAPSAVTYIVNEYLPGISPVFSLVATTTATSHTATLPASEKTNQHIFQILAVNACGTGVATAVTVGPKFQVGTATCPTYRGGTATTPTYRVPICSGN
jgi:hypothetical protein